MLRRLVAAITAVLLWQAVFVAPQPVAADNPPGVDCGAGLVCAPDSGGGQLIIPPSGPLQVSDGSDDVIQDTAFDPNDPTYVPPASAWGFLEAEALAYISGVHQVERDSRINEYDRGEIRAYLIARLLDIAKKPAASRTIQEQTAFNTLRSLVHKAQLTSAQNAIYEYNRWALNPCGYYYPAPLTSTSPSYYEMVQGPCSGADQGNATPDPPSAEQFEGIGSAMYFNDLKAKLSSNASDAIAKGSTFLGGLAGAAAIGAITGVLIAYIPALSSIFVTGGALAIFPFAAYGTAAAAAGGAAAGVGGFTAALGVGSAIAIALAGAVVTAIALWQLIENASIPGELADNKSQFANLPDLNAMASDNGAGTATIASVITLATTPDYPGTGAPPAHSASDSQFLDADCPSGTCASTSRVDSISFSDDSGSHSMYITDGWLSVDNKYALLFSYHDWNGTQKLAGISGSKFIIEDPNDPTKTTVVDHIDYENGSDQREATIDPKTPPTLHPTITGTAAEGNTLTFNANTTPGDPNDTVSVQWLFENPFGQKYDTQILPGLSVLQGCYNGPISATVNGFTLSCPWDKATGSQATYKYTKWGQWHVRVIATESNGAVASEVFEVNVADLSPGFVPNTFSEQVTGSDEGSTSVMLTGQVNDIGDDPLAVVADWGDGTTDSQFFPCDWTAQPTFTTVDGIQVPTFPPNFCIGDALDTQLRVKPAAHPSSFSLQHTYLNNPIGDTQFHPTLLVKDDGNFWNSIALSPVTVNDVAPAFGIACSFPVPVPAGYINVQGCELRSGDTSYSVPVSGDFYDPGADGPWWLTVDWGDGNNPQGEYPCPDPNACAFSSTPTISGVFGTTPYVFFSVHHTYASPGTYTITATLAGSDGSQVTRTSSAVITAPPDTTDPTITLTTPANSAHYSLNSTVDASYSCHDDTAIATCIGTVANGAPIDTSTLGTHQFTVNATDTTGNPAQTVVTYNIVDLAPTVSVTTPLTGSMYDVGQVIKANYSCADDVQLVSCVGTVPLDAALNTSTPGDYTFTVTAKDSAGHVTTRHVPYRVIYAFSFVGSIHAPPGINVVTAGQKLRIQFSLGGRQGLPVTMRHARHAPMNCSTDQQVGTWTTGGLSGVGYQYKTKTYYLVWQTTAAMAGACQVVQIRTLDGRQAQLWFHFAP